MIAVQYNLTFENIHEKNKHQIQHSSYLWRGRTRMKSPRIHNFFFFTLSMKSNFFFKNMK